MRRTGIVIINQCVWQMTNAITIGLITDIFRRLDEVDWCGHHVHPTFPEVVPAIGANLVTFYWGTRRVGQVWSLARQFAKYGEWVEFAASFGHSTAERFSASEVLPPIRGRPGPHCMRALPPHSRYIGSLFVVAMCVHPTFLPWRRPWKKVTIGRPGRCCKIYIPADCRAQDVYCWMFAPASLTPRHYVLYSYEIE